MLSEGKVNGEPIIIEQGKMIHEVCCECGFTHAVFYRISDCGKAIQKTAYIDEYETRKWREKVKQEKREKIWY